MSLRADLPDKYVVANGHSTRYIEKGDGPPLICLHGLNASLSADQWLVAIDALSSVAHVYCLDLPGWGLSDLPESGYSYPMFIETIKGFCDALGLEQVDVAGQSMGGWFAALLAYYHPQLVRRVVLIVNAGLNPPLPGVGQSPFQLLNREQIRGAMTREWTRYLPLEEAHLDELERRMQRPGREAAYRALQAEILDEGNRATYSLRDKLPQMQQPILVCWGDNASGIRLRYGLEAFELAPNARLVVTYGGDHNPMGFTAREFEAQVAAFLTDPEVKPVK